MYYHFTPIAQTGVSLMETDYAVVRPAADDIFAALKLKALIAVPVENEAGEVEAVLFVADDRFNRAASPIITPT